MSCCSSEMTGTVHQFTVHSLHPAVFVQKQGMLDSVRHDSKSMLHQHCASDSNVLFEGGLGGPARRSFYFGA